MAKKKRLPKIGQHSSGQARVTLNGRVHYLGAFGSIEAQAKYVDLIQRWEAGGRQPLEPAATVVQMITLRDVLETWLAQLDGAHRYQKRGEITSAGLRLKRNVRAFLRRFGDVRAAKYTERLLLQHRDDLERNATLTRVGINRMVGCVRDGIRWAFERGHISRDAYLSTMALRPLSRAVAGHRDVRKPKRAPSAQEIEAVAAAAKPELGRMLRVHFALGCRPGELLAMRWADIDRTPIEGCWTYTVREDVAKSAHHGTTTTYAIPPAVQRLLEGLPVRAPGAPLFESTSPRIRGTGCTIAWRTQAYTLALRRACVRAGVPPFTGHEVRHGAITAACAKFGTFAASTFANHGRIATTENYVHRDNRDRYRVAVGLSEAAAGQG